MKRTVSLFLSALLLSLPALANAVTAKVIDQTGAPLVGVTVLIGTALDQPFKGNQVTTNEKGEFTVPTEWQGELPISISGPDLVRTTIFKALPTQTTYSVSRGDGDQKLELEGRMNGFGDLRTDGKVDVGVFVPSLQRSQFIYFDISWLVSPETDIIRILGREVAVPSNIVLPRQEERYIFPITLDKPNFRMFVRRPGNYRFLSLHGQFPLKKVVDDIRGGASAMAMINHITLKQASILDLNVSGKQANLTPQVNQIQFSQNIPVTMPTLKNNEVVVSVALSQMDETDLYLPSDIRRINSQETTRLNTPVGAKESFVLSALLRESLAPMTVNTPDLNLLSPDTLDLPIDILYRGFGPKVSAEDSFKQVSLTLHGADGVAPKFLAHVSPPQVQGDKVIVTPPALVDGVTPVGVLVLYSAIKGQGQGEMKVEQRTRLWELWTPNWDAREFSLPQLPNLGQVPADNYRWEVLYLGRSGNKDITHVTRNAIDVAK